ncbi:hypothetical protein [Micromonospora sp. NPDC049374]|uniref:hypothetical protein n=1 Tax=Micromonospora sp. NPDC049374 TaxID=3154352 RepID=UPI003429780B
MSRNVCGVAARSRRRSGKALRFYRRLHARTVDEIDVLRLDGPQLQALAAGRHRREADHAAPQ